jgi:hypothetical protein
MSTDYRWIARHAVERARNELITGDPDRLPYAALELRYAMEALTYDKAQSYKDEVPPDLYRTWQPRKLVEYITEFDDKAYLSSSLAFGVEDIQGEPAKVMQPLGTATAFTMKDLKAHYDAIGSILHIPTFHQIKEGKAPDRERLRERCERCVNVLEGVLASPIWNANFGLFAELECIRCQFPIKKRLTPGFTEPVDARCINCGAEYTVTDEGPGKTAWLPKAHKIPCPTPECSETVVLWNDRLRPGTAWKCEGCGKGYMLVLSIQDWSPGDSPEAESVGDDSHL